MTIVNVCISESDQKERVYSDVWNVFSSIYPPRHKISLCEVKPWKSESIFQALVENAESVFRSHIMNPNVDLWLILETESEESSQFDVIGMATFCYLEDEDTKYDCRYHLTCVGIIHSHRRRGYMTDLLETAVLYYPDRGVYLEVNRANPAILLYEKCGYQKILEHPHTYNPDFEEEYEDSMDVVMTYTPPDTI